MQPFWRKLLFSLMVVALAMPLATMSAGATSADQLTVRITAPKAGEKMNGFYNTAFVISNRLLGTPMRREANPYRTGGVEVPMAEVLERLTAGTNELLICLG